MLRWAWGQLTSMRTALFLLFLLALAAIPGSMIPQQSISPISVMDFQKANPFWDRIFEPLGFYNIYTSPMFSAVYLLLFVSLIGCILPRIGKYLRAVRKPPPKLPARIER
ncbi:MAG TPA: cytochrome c biogenesis protein ResB, partial [Tessaracoccus flavescens]|nr:cytochrome c biogenesis protein ResB [Tessaracoccus flavescens]